MTNEQAQLAGRCIVCDKGHYKDDSIKGIRVGFIECSICDVKYIIEWMVLKTFRGGKLDPDDGAKLIKAARIENKIGRQFYLGIAEFEKLFGRLPQDYEAGSPTGI